RLDTPPSIHRRHPLSRIAHLTALATTQYPEIRIGDGQPQPRMTYDHFLVQARLSNGMALSAEIAGGRPTGTPFRFEIVGEGGILTLEGGAPRGFQSGRLRLHVNGEPQMVDEGDLASLPDAALNVAATYADLRDDIAGGTSNAPGFTHAVRLAGLIEDAMTSSRNGLRKTLGDWPAA
ncbi:hypothetical protein G3T14_16860, partial [Methylobacterium sp. BTF04]|uniref:hypothetical protein n=1 Tax=Methylobacterium sp. BTF04 TaxID=2708300 RepID=UPI001400578F